MKSILVLSLLLKPCISKTKDPAEEQAPVQARTSQSMLYDIWE